MVHWDSSLQICLTLCKVLTFLNYNYFVTVSANHICLFLISDSTAVCRISA